MTEFSFSQLFSTTNKGIPDLSTLPQSVTMALPYYIYSLILQIIIFFIFILYFILAIYRVAKKIKNSKFTDIPKDLQKNQQQNMNGDADGRTKQVYKKEENNRDDNLIYRFDEESEQKEEDNSKIQQKKEDKIQTQENNKIEEKSQNYDDYHDQNEQYFIYLDHKLLFLQPFLISFIVCNSVFAADAITIIMVVLMLLSYFLFNIKNLFGHIRMLSMLFIGFSILGFLSFFTNDHDLTT